MKTIHEQNVFNKEIVTIKKNHTEILKLNNTMTEWKNSTEFQQELSSCRRKIWQTRRQII